MFKLYREALKTTNVGIILAVPLALFWWIMSLYANFSTESINTIPKLLLAIVTILFMTSTFFSGWFYMVKKAVNFSKKDFIFDKDKSSESLRLVKAIPIGVGHFFLYFLEASVLFFALTIFLGFLIKVSTQPFVAEINNVLSSLNIAVTSTEEMSALMETFTSDQIINLFKLLLFPSTKLLITIGFVSAIFSYLLMLWIPEIIYTKRNASVALFTSIKKVIITFPKSFKLYLYIVIIQVLLTCIGVYTVVNPILCFLSMVLYFYFLVYVVVLLFTYYDFQFNKKQQ